MSKRALAVSAVLLAGLTALLVWSTSSVSVEQARLERILSLLELDSELFWRQRPDLDTTFEGTVVRTDRAGFRLPSNPEGDSQAKQDGPVIVTLGASPTFGYGVQAEDTYAAYLQGALEDRFTGLRVVNAGQIGYSTWQGLRLLARHAKDWRPSVVTVSYVVNDVDRLRFFRTDGRSDRDSSPPSAFAQSLHNFAHSFAPTAFLVRLRDRLLARLLGSVSRRAIYEMTKVRVPPTDYEANLKSFVALTRAMGATLVFIKMPLRLPQDLPPEAPGQNDRLQDALLDIERGNLDQAAETTQDLLAKGCRGSLLQYACGRVSEALGDDEKARDYYQRAMQELVVDCARDAAIYNGIMERVARETQTTLVDPSASLGATHANMELYVSGDYIHPNRAGHTKIGQCLQLALERILSGAPVGFIQKCK